jgi:hypothetical protein
MANHLGVLGEVGEKATALRQGFSSQLLGAIAAKLQLGSWPDASAKDIDLFEYGGLVSKAEET